MSYASELEEFLKKVSPYLESPPEDMENTEEEVFTIVEIDFISVEVAARYKEEAESFYHDKLDDAGYVLWKGFSAKDVTLELDYYEHLLKWFKKNRPGVLGVEEEWKATCTIQVEYDLSAGDDIPKEGR
jgi:hypothetical protein